MLTTLTPLASGGHADSELWCPQRLQCQSFVVLIPPFLWHCYTLSLLMLTETNSTSKSLVNPAVIIWYARHYTLCLLIVVLFWRKVHQNVGLASLLNQSLFCNQSHKLQKFEWGNFNHSGAHTRSKYCRLFTLVFWNRCHRKLDWTVNGTEA